jgi:NuA3 HAT complex component NTO1
MLTQQFLAFIRKHDLERVRVLAELVSKREKQKLRQAQIIKEIVDDYLFPGYEKLRLTLEKISA